MPTVMLGNDAMNEIDKVHRPNTVKELIDLTRLIIKKRKYLLIESRDEKTILVGIRTANSFNVGVDLINDSQYNRLSDFFERWGAIETINYVANAVWNSQRGN